MDYVGVPRGSGLPRLPLPTNTPVRPPLRFLLVLVLWIISHRADGGLSRRELQEDLNRVGGEAVSANLKKLVNGKWLSIRKKATGKQSHRYKLGMKLTMKAGAETCWRELATKLFDKNGLVFGLIDNSSFGHRFLGINGMLVLGTLKSSRRPLTVSEIAVYLQMFMSRQTINNRLKKLSQNDLVVETSEGWSVVSTLREMLSKYEPESGALAKKANIERTIKIERQNRDIRLEKGVLTREQKEEILAQGCFNCHTTTGRLELEHFPPKRWGGRDHFDLVLCLCWKCNNKYSHQIKTLPALELDKFIRITLDEKAFVPTVVVAILEYNAHRFYRALNENRIEDARQISYQTLNIWCALIEGTISCRVTRAVKGKPTKVTYVRMRKEKPIRKKTGEIGTRYIGSRLQRDWPEGSAKDLNKAAF